MTPITGRILVVEVGKPVPLSIGPKQVARVDIFALTTNTKTVAIGDETVSEVAGNESGLPLSATDYVTYTDVDLSEWFIDAKVAGEGVRWLAVV